MKIEIHLSEYWFPVLLAFFKAMHWAPAIQWWRAVSKRHYSYKKVAKRQVADATIDIDLFWLANLISEPKEAIIFWAKHYTYMLKKQLIWVLTIFVLPYQLAYLTITAWILVKYIRLMDMLNDGIAAGENWFLFGMSYADILAYITPGGIWEAYSEYVRDDIKQAFIVTDGYEYCQCEGCKNRRTLMQAMSVYESGEGDNVHWVNDTLHAYNVGELDITCTQGEDKPEFNYVPLDHVLADLINKGAATLVPGGTEPTLFKDPAHLQMIPRSTIDQLRDLHS